MTWIRLHVCSQGFPEMARIPSIAGLRMPKARRLCLADMLGSMWAFIKLVHLVANFAYLVAFPLLLPPCRGLQPTTQSLAGSQLGWRLDPRHFS